MGKEKRIFKSEDRMDRKGVSAFLAQLSQKIAEGKVILRQGEEELVLRTPGTMMLEIQVEEEDKGGRGIQHSLEVELKWFDDEQEGGPVQLG